MFEPSDFEEDFQNCHLVNLTSVIVLLFRWAASATQTQLLSMV
jgi:hypothetical protein